jgi:hypothetical protein
VPPSLQHALHLRTALGRGLLQQPAYSAAASGDAFHRRAGVCAYAPRAVKFSVSMGCRAAGVRLLLIRDRAPCPADVRNARNADQQRIAKQCRRRANTGSQRAYSITLLVSEERPRLLDAERFSRGQTSDFRGGKIVTFDPAPTATKFTTSLEELACTVSSRNARAIVVLAHQDAAPCGIRPAASFASVSSASRRVRSPAGSGRPRRAAWPDHKGVKSADPERSA